ncbi:Basic proline-rich protein precursor [Pseudonocardia sp. Ae263_Ps1]|nr:Basic proline-rich protein precursor [Pseudonocardia sp. Ae263_Ps1]
MRPAPRIYVRGVGRPPSSSRAVFSMSSTPPGPVTRPDLDPPSPPGHPPHPIPHPADGPCGTRRSQPQRMPPRGNFPGRLARERDARPRAHRVETRTSHRPPRKFPPGKTPGSPRRAPASRATSSTGHAPAATSPTGWHNRHPRQRPTASDPAGREPAGGEPATGAAPRSDRGPRPIAAATTTPAAAAVSAAVSAAAVSRVGRSRDPAAPTEMPARKFPRQTHRRARLNAMRA